MVVNYEYCVSVWAGFTWLRYGPGAACFVQALKLRGRKNSTISLVD